MRIIITGGAGFIGSHLCERLLKEGNKVICVDNLITGSKKNIAAFLKNPHFKFIKHDITKPLKIKEPISQIYNLACPASPVDYQTIPIETLLVNSFGTKNMLDLAVKNQALFLQASTSEIYGDPLVHPQPESYFGNVNCHGERSCYDEGKRFAESLVINYQKKHGIQIKIIRIFNTYGPKMRKNDGRVIPNFITQALKNKPITIYGEGKQTRSFCYIDDMIEGIIKMMKTKNFSGPVNLGNDKEISIKNLAQKIIQLTKSKSKIIFKPLPKDDPLVRRPDLTLAKKALNYQAKTDLEQGLQKIIEWFKK